MKTIGMIGGMSWESSSVYYQQINREVQKRLGDVHSARLLVHSFDFAEITALWQSGDFDEANRRIAQAAVALDRAGADFVFLACNTGHAAAHEIESAIQIPLLHIADPLGTAIDRAGFTRVGLIGTRQTMENDAVLKGRLTERFALTVITPSGADADEANRIIFEEFTRGKFLESARAHFRRVIAALVEQGAQGIILGCTELPLLLTSEEAAVPLFDTTVLHAMAVVDMALA
jgi:aspartate racemase